MENEGETKSTQDNSPQLIKSAPKPNEQKFIVILNVYDLSMGLASKLSKQMTGKHFDGIYHTGIAVYGKEYFFGGGIQSTTEMMTPFGTPQKQHVLGYTEMSQSMFEEILQSLRQKFSMTSYDLLTNNCNNFTATAAEFLTGKSIPEYISNLPTEFLKTPMGKMAKPFIDQMMGGMQQMIPNQSSSSPNISNSGNSSFGNDSNSGSNNNFGNNSSFGSNNNSGSNNNFGNNFMAQGMQQMMNNPQMMQQMMQNNPMVQQMARNNPMVQQMMNNPQMMQQMLNDPSVQQMMNNPQMMRQMMQNNPMLRNNPMMRNMFGNGNSNFGGRSNNTNSTGNSSNYNPYASNQQESKPKGFEDDRKIIRYTKSNVSKVVEGIQKILKENNIELNEAENNLIQSLKNTISKGVNNDEVLDLLFKLYQAFPKNKVYPLLDILRLMVANPIVALKCVQKKHPILLECEKLLEKWDDLPMPTQLMTHRVFCNIFGKTVHESKVAMLYISQTSNLYENLSNSISTSLESKLDGIRLTAVNMACNIALLAKHDQNDDELQLLLSMSSFLNEEKNEEIAERMAVCMYRFMKGEQANIDYVKGMGFNLGGWKFKAKRKLFIQVIKELYKMLS